MPWNEKSKSTVPGEAPVSGSVSKISDREWRMRLFNNTDDDYSVDVKVQQNNASGNTLKYDNFSYRLKAKQSVERSVSSTPATADAQLVLLNWKNLTNRSKTQPLATGTQEASAAGAPTAVPTPMLVRGLGGKVRSAN